MALVSDNRFDFRKGLSTSFSQDARDHFELSKAKNARLGSGSDAATDAGEYGAAAKRAGSQRMHLTAIGAPTSVLGLHSWKPSAQQLVGVSNQKLYYKAQGDTDFTSLATVTLDASALPVFAQFDSAGSPVLYLAEGSLRKFTGSAISTISAAPAGLKFIAVYKGRMFGADGTKVLYWSKVADAETWATPDGGQGNVDTYDAKGITALAVVGGVLMIFKNNSIARFTGVDQTDIQLDQQTDGISSEIGCVAPKTVVHFEDVVFFLSDRGPYVASEAGIQPVGLKIDKVFRSIAPDHLANAVAVPIGSRFEVLLMIPPTGQTQNTLGYLLNVRQRSWTGPIVFPYNVCAAAAHQLDSGAGTMVLGGYDGFVRDGDVIAYGAKDDVLRDGTGGTNVTMELELPTLLFGDPMAVKRMVTTCEIAADLKTNGSLTVAVSSDLSGTVSPVLASKGQGVKQYDLRPGPIGRRITWNMQDATAEIVQINGVSLTADLQRRVV